MEINDKFCYASPPSRVGLKALCNPLCARLPGHSLVSNRPPPNQNPRPGTAARRSLNVPYRVCDNRGIRGDLELSTLWTRFGICSARSFTSSVQCHLWDSISANRVRSEYLLSFSSCSREVQLPDRCDAHCYAFQKLPFMKNIGKSCFKMLIIMQILMNFLLL